MEDDGWKDVKKKVPRKTNASSTTSNSNKRYVPLEVVEIKPVTGAVTNTQPQKYQPPSMKTKSSNTDTKHKVNTNSNNTNTNNRDHGGKHSENRGGKSRGGRGGFSRWKQDLATIPDFADEDEKEKFLEIQKTSPHIMLPGAARRSAISMRIDNFAEMFTSDDWIEFQCKGWKYHKVIKPDDGEFEVPEDGNYEVLSLDNKWGDYILFKKID